MGEVDQTILYHVAYYLSFCLRRLASDILFFSCFFSSSFSLLLSVIDGCSAPLAFIVSTPSRHALVGHFSTGKNAQVRL